MSEQLKQATWRVQGKYKRLLWRRRSILKIPGF